MNISLRRMVVYAFLGVLCTIAQQVMAPLPNIEPVSLLVMLYAVCFGMESLWAVYVYVFLEYLLYGFNLWSLSYLYVWAILFLIAWKLRSVESVVSFALLSGVFGLAFGALCALVYLVLFGWQSALSWWMAGLAFDGMHALGNIAMALLLFKPLRTVFLKLSERYSIG